MANLKYRLIKLADWIDEHIIGHRFYWLCQLIGLSSWWGENVIDYSQIAEIKQRLGLLTASIDTEFEEWVSLEVGKYWHEDVPYLLKCIELLAEWNTGKP